MRKLKSSKGLTLVEMLACIITLLLLAGICGLGMDLAVKSYNESVYESDSQMLESTLNLYISDILRHATAVEIDADIEADAEGLKPVIGFMNNTYDIYGGTIGVPEGADEINAGMIVAYDRPAGGEGVEDDDIKQTLIVGKNVYAGTLYIDDFVLEYNEENGCFVGSYKIKSTVLKSAERICTFTCRSVAVNE